MFEQVFKNIDDVLWKEAGCTTELDYTEQASWLLFLKYLDTLEQEKALEAQLDGRKYTHILDKPYRWQSWAAPKGKDGKLDHNAAMTGDDLRDFVNQKLFPYLHSFKQKATGPNTIEYKIGEIFGEIKNKIQSGYNLREIIDQIDELRFGSQTEKHELSHLYEAKIKNMGNAGRNGGEYPIHFQKALHRVRFHESEHGKWFVYFLFSQDLSGELKRHFNGAGIQHFTGETLARFELPLPPLPELRKAVAKFDELAEETQRLESLYQQKLDALEALKKSLLHQAFTGRL